MRPMAAAAIGALISGVAFYAVGARAAQNPFAEMPALVQTIDGRYIEVPNARALGYAPGSAYVAAPGYTAAPRTTVLPAAAPAVVRQAPARTVYRTAAPAQEERVVVERTSPQRSWAKTAMVIGGTSAAGAGVGGLMGGKRGAMVGAAIGGGAASIYEASRRR